MRADLTALERAEPAMPVEDRAADTWEPLVVVADYAGGSWPDRARTAVLTLTGDRDFASAVASRVLTLEAASGIALPLLQAAEAIVVKSPASIADVGM